MPNMSLQERFYNAVLGYKPFYETTMNLSLEYDIQLRQEHINNIENRIIATNKNKSKEYTFIPVGTFTNNKFTWNNTSIKQLILEHVNEYSFVQQNYISFNDLNQYFEDDVIQINDEKKDFLIYLISITNSAFNLIKFSSPDNAVHFYGMIDLKIKDNFDYQVDFLDKIN
jgi:hypothetical protein